MCDLMMHVPGIFLELRELFIDLHLLFFQQRDNIIDVRDLIRFVFEQLFELRECHAGSLEAVDAVQPVDVFLGVDSLSGSGFLNICKKPFLFIIAEGGEGKRKKTGYFTDCISLHKGHLQSESRYSQATPLTAYCFLQSRRRLV